MQVMDLFFKAISVDLPSLHIYLKVVVAFGLSFQPKYHFLPVFFYLTVCVVVCVSLCEFFSGCCCLSSVCHPLTTVYIVRLNSVGCLVGHPQTLLVLYDIQKTGYLNALPTLDSITSEVLVKIVGELKSKRTTNLSSVCKVYGLGLSVLKSRAILNIRVGNQI